MIGKDYRAFVQEFFAGDLANAALGLCGEMAELGEDLDGEHNPLAEAGDCLFYATAMAEVVGATNEMLATYENRYYHTDTAHLDAMRSACLLAEMAKKTLYGTSSAKPTPLNYACHLTQVIEHLDFIIADHGYTLEFVMNANMAKLRKRWPKGFGK